MKITYIRSSSYNNFDFCQMQYYISYVLGVPQDSNKKADMGTIVHKVMEILAGCKLNIQNNDGNIYLDDSIGKVVFTNSQILDNDPGLVKSLIKKVYKYYSEKYNHHNKLAKTKWTQEDYQTCHDWCFMVFEYGGMYDPRQRNILANEKRFDFCIERDWAKYDYTIDGKKVEGYLGLKGTIDLVTTIDDDTIEVVDYKTGQCKNWATGKKKDLEYFQNEDFQLMLYYYALKHLYPDKNILLTILWIRDGGPFTVSFDDLGLIERKLRSRYNEIKECMKPKMISENQSDFKCRLLCHYYKNNWPGTKDNICKHVKKTIDKHGIDKTTTLCKDNNHTIGKYNAPG